MVDIRAKGILFDMDGTLVNTVQCVEKWWRQLASEHNVDINELLHNVHGHPTFDVLCKWFPEPMHTRQHAQDFESGLMNDPDGVFAVPGAPELLRTLHDREWAIVTAATEVLALTRLQQAGIECPQYMVTDRSVQKGKPHPECYELGARMLGIEPRDAVVFEDSVNGAVAGHAAGATVIGVLTSTTEDKLRAAGAQYVVNDFSNVRISRDGDTLIISL